MSHLALQAQINLQVLALKIATRQIGKGVLTTNKKIAFFFNLSVAFSDAISFHSYILIYLLYPYLSINTFISFSINNLASVFEKF